VIANFSRKNVGSDYFEACFLYFCWLDVNKFRDFFNQTTCLQTQTTVPLSRDLLHECNVHIAKKISSMQEPWVTCWTYWCTFFLWGAVSPPLPNTKLEDHPLSAVATLYSIYSRLLSISGGRLLHSKIENAPWDRDPFNVAVACDNTGTWKGEIYSWKQGTQTHSLTVFPENL
jgi:hypothetical protein